MTTFVRKSTLAIQSCHVDEVLQTSVRGSPEASPAVTGYTGLLIYSLRFGPERLEVWLCGQLTSCMDYGWSTVLTFLLALPTLRLGHEYKLSYLLILLLWEIN